MSRRHLRERYLSSRHGHSALRVIAECAALGFVAGWLLGFATGHFVTAIVPGIVGAVVFAALGLLFRRA